MKCFEALNIIVEFVFRMGSDSSRQQSPFMTKSIQILPFVIITARMFACDVNLPQYLQNDELSELIVQIIDFIVACCQEAEFKDIIMRESENLII